MKHWRLPRKPRRKNYIMTPFEFLLSTLKTAAARAEYGSQSAATDKQIYYLAKLIDDAGEAQDAAEEYCTQTDFVLTKREASTWIGTYVD